MPLHSRCLVKLTVLMVKHSNIGDYSTKLGLLKEVLSKVTTALHWEHETKEKSTAEKCTFLMLLDKCYLLCSPDVSGFAFHWLEIVGHRNFIGQLLANNCGSFEGFSNVQSVVLAHLKFMAPFLRDVQMSESVEVLYKGTFRLLLGFFTNFPEVFVRILQCLL
uniref:CCR4-Not complex component Not1 C-terminal domain-containing protein n=1 Tax=Ditylenchus dipsaci TaxID=166011 RepID=A0A915E9Q1_9BILA